MLGRFPRFLDHGGDGGLLMGSRDFIEICGSQAGGIHPEHRFGGRGHGGPLISVDLEAVDDSDGFPRRESGEIVPRTPRLGPTISDGSQVRGVHQGGGLHHRDSIFDQDRRSKGDESAD